MLQGAGSMKTANVVISNSRRFSPLVKFATVVFFASLVVTLGQQSAFAQCTLSSPDTWTDGNGNWSVAGNWSGGVPTSSTNACITDGTSAVTLAPSTTGSVDSLQLASGNTLDLGLNSTLTVSGSQIINDGSISVMGGSASNTILSLDNNVTLSGTGVLTLSVGGGGGSSYVQQGTGGVTLTNQSTIQGTGVIGNGGMALINSGTINANVSGQALALNPGGRLSNSGLMEASNGGILQLIGNTVAGAGHITANSGSTVQLFASVDIVGGTLTNNGGTLGTLASSVASLDGSTGAGAITINGTYTSDSNADTYLLGTIKNNGTIQVNGGGGGNAILLADSANVMLTGGSTVNLSVAGGSGSAYIEQATGGVTLTNVNNIIQGAGVIGNGGLALVNQASGVIDANSSAQTLVINPGAGTTNAGLMEASGGGVLQFAGGTVLNGGGHITANSGSTVQFFGSVMIQGGTLTNNGSFMGTPVSSVAYLDGSTGAGSITINGNYTNDINANTYLLGTINNNGTFQVNGGGGSNAISCPTPPMWRCKAVAR
jgi:hypothetical protein